MVALAENKKNNTTMTGTKRKQTANTTNISNTTSILPPGRTVRPVTRYSKKMSDAIIKLFQEQALAGAFRVTRKGAMKEGFEAVAKGMERQFRDKQWTVDKVSDKYDNEKKKYWLFINFLDISGTSYDDETGLLDGSSEN